MASLVLVAAGQALGTSLFGTAIGGALGGLAGSLVANALFPSPDQHSEGQRLDNLTVSGGTDGAPIPMLWGNGRIAGQIIFAGELEEQANTETSGGKGSGPKATHTSYTYTCTYAAGFGHARLDTPKVRKVWSNKSLTEDYSAGADAVHNGQPISWYDGTQTEPDADLVALIGEGNVPAYTGLMYGVYVDRDLTDYGNRPPAPEAEICTSYSASVPTNDVIVSATGRGANGGQSYCHATNKLYVTYDRTGAINALLAEIDPYTQQVVQTVDLGYSNDTDCLAISEYGTYGIGGILLVNARNGDGLKAYSTKSNLSVVAAISGAYTEILAESEAYVLLATGGNMVAINKGDWSTTNFADPVSYTSGNSAVRISSNQFLVAMNNGTSFGVLTLDGAGAGTWSVTDNSSYSPTADSRGAITDNDGSHWFAASATNYYLLRVDDTGAVIEEVDLSALGGTGWSGGAGTPVITYDSATDCIYSHALSKVNKYDVGQGTVTLYADGTQGAWCHYHSDTGTVWTGDGGDSSGAIVSAVRLNVVEPDSIIIGDVIADICDQKGIVSAQRDTSALTDTIGGYTLAQPQAAANSVDTLLRVGLSEITASDWVLTCVPLGGSSAVTIDAEKLGARPYGSGSVVPLEITEPDTNALPRKYQLHYISSDMDLQQGLAEYDDHTATSDVVKSLSVPVVMSDSEAAILVQVMLQMSRTARTYRFSLPPSYAKYEATDVVTVPTNQGNERVRLLRVDRGANGVMQCEAISDRLADLSATALAGGSGVTTATIASSSPADLIVMDLPLLRDFDSNAPGNYLAGYTYGSAYPGVAFFSSPDAQNYNNFSTVTTQPVVGTCSTVPSAAGFEDWDDTNTLRVSLRTSGTLASTTDAAVLAGANAFAWGKPGRWEVAQFGTAALVSTGVYDISHLLRGRRGTDGDISSHESGDWIVILNNSSIARELLTTADIGSTRYYKAPTLRQAVADAVSTEYTLGYMPLKPYSPINLIGGPSGSDIDITWDWRTRTGGVYGGAQSLTDGVPGSMSDEDSGEIQIIDTDGSTVLATYPVTGESYTYDSADIASDHGGSAPAIVRFRARQDSATSGVEGQWSDVRGYAGDADAWTQDVMDDEPDTWHRFDETTGTTALDMMGADNGTYGGGYTQGVIAHASLSNKAMTLDGSTGRIENLDDVYSREHGFTIEILFKHVMTTNGVMYSEVHYSDYTYSFVLRTGSSGDAFEAYLSDQGGNTLTFAHQTTGLNDGAWHYLAFVQDNTALRTLYVDGVASTANTTSIPDAINGQNVTVGAFVSPGGVFYSHFAGSLDELVRHSRALTAAEIAARWATL